MKTYVCIDDTDILGGRGTGHLAATLIERIEEKGWGKCSYITRHQLYFHPDIPYTSHNSAMCFAIEHEQDIFTELRDFAAEFLVAESEDGSDPGLCIAVEDKIKDRQALMDYGRRAKSEILTKRIAYDLAEAVGVHLSEHGGTGSGVIGALAGVGLRLTGNDGRIKGKLTFPLPGDLLTVEQILAHSDVDRVQSLAGEVLGPDQPVKLGEKVKAVFLDHQKVLLVYPEDGLWHTCTKEQLKQF
ncbi:MAG: hypothetical protein GX058_01705 [Firmicutes bacterium]|nr:hypothetical protein [Bacillota bacterium]